jgi:hypothetical protein
MPHEPVLLAALIAPGSIESEVGKVQAVLFSEHGLASAQALPPLIPIAFLDAARVDRGFLLAMNRAVSPGWRMRLTGALWAEGHLYAGVESGGTWGALRDCALGRCGAEKGRLFPAAEGFYLGCGDATPEVRVRIKLVLPETSFSSCMVALLNIVTAFDGPEWWREVSWEIVEERSLRGRRKQ